MLQSETHPVFSEKKSNEVLSSKTPSLSVSHDAQATSRTKK